MRLATILIEDTPTIRDSLIPALAELGNAEVIAVAETAAECIGALRTHAASWHLSVLDMLLKDGNGLEVLRAGQGRRDDQHMLVLTNYATPDIRRRANAAGADAVFDKSTEVDLFFDLCKQYAVERERSLSDRRPARVRVVRQHRQ